MIASLAFKARIDKDDLRAENLERLTVAESATNADSCRPRFHAPTAFSAARAARQIAKGAVSASA